MAENVRGECGERTSRVPVLRVLPRLRPGTTWTATASSTPTLRNWMRTRRATALRLGGWSWSPRNRRPSGCRAAAADRAPGHRGGLRYRRGRRPDLAPVPDAPSWPRPNRRRDRASGDGAAAGEHSSSIVDGYVAEVPRPELGLGVQVVQRQPPPDQGRRWSSCGRPGAAGPGPGPRRGCGVRVDEPGAGRVDLAPHPDRAGDRRPGHGRAGPSLHQGPGQRQAGFTVVVDNACSTGSPCSGFTGTDLESPLLPLRAAHVEVAPGQTASVRVAATAPARSLGQETHRRSRSPPTTVTGRSAP